MRHAFGARMGAMRGGERVVHEHVGQPRQIGREGRVVLLVSGVIPGVFQNRDIAIAKTRNGLLGNRADTVVREEHRLA